MDPNDLDDEKQKTYKTIVFDADNMPTSMSIVYKNIADNKYVIKTLFDEKDLFI